MQMLAQDEFFLVCTSLSLCGQALLWHVGFLQTNFISCVAGDYFF